MSLFNIFDIASSGLKAQNVRLNLTASNMANADSIASSSEESYRARHPVFKATLDQLNNAVGNVTTVETIAVIESQVEPLKSYQPGNPMADKDGYVYGSNVNPMEEMTNMISASRSYQSNVEILEASKKLLLDTLKIGQ